MRAFLAAACLALSPLASLSTAFAASTAAAPATVADEFPEDWFWRNGPTGAKHRSMTGKAAP